MTTTERTSLTGSRRTPTNPSEPTIAAWHQESLFTPTPLGAESENPLTREPPPTGGSAQPPLHPQLVTPESAALLLGVGRTTIFRLMKEGELTAIHIGRCTRLSVFEIDCFVQRRLAESRQRLAG